MSVILSEDLLSLGGAYIVFSSYLLLITGKRSFLFLSLMSFYRGKDF